MREFWVHNLDVVFFFYGLSFIVAGLLIFTQRRDSSRRSIARTFGWLAAFALVHGANEWLDMWQLSRGDSAVVRTTGLHLLTISLIFLFEFGRRAFALSSRGKWLAGCWPTVGLAAACLALMATAGNEPAVWPRYLLAFPGGLLAAAGIGLYLKENPAIQALPLRRYLLADAVALAFYAVLSGLVVPPADFFPASVINQPAFLDIVGIPVQIFRALCAVVVACATWSMLRFFNGEDYARLQRETATREQAEAQLLQGQKLQAVGLLAAGLAHDFNNVLTTIVGYNYFVLEGLEPGSPLRSLSLEIRKAADLAASLSRHVLAVSRKQTVLPQVMEPDSVIMEMAKMFRRLLGENIKLDFHPHPSLWPVKMDCGQLEQVLMNLVVNARDAMPRGGRLVIATRNQTVRDGGGPEAGLALPPGHYVCLEVRDTGTGMDAHVRARLFEPLFTTKPAGRGTGLGLSTVKSIVRDCGGGISVESAPGQGSAFRIYLPRAEGGPEALLPGEARKTGGEGHETILVVEDNATLRSLIKRILKEKGYRVFSAATGKEARLLCRRLREHLDLLLCDLILPDCYGTEVAKKVCAARPGIKVAYMTGYPGGVMGSDFNFDGAVLIEKPFSPETLLRCLRRLLDSKPASAAR
ncbi:MAG: ATP-binding protein [Elusimicrobia bacterium]|nr:ATP-binding protein [Elusimicrobiota bacterium]